MSKCRRKQYSAFRFSFLHLAVPAPLLDLAHLNSGNILFSIFANTILVNNFHYSLNISFSLPHLQTTVSILPLKVVHLTLHWKIFCLPRYCQIFPWSKCPSLSLFVFCFFLYFEFLNSHLDVCKLPLNPVHLTFAKQKHF